MGCERAWWEMVSCFPAASAAAIIWSHSRTETAIGFSVTTCFPAWNAASATGQCR